MEILFSIPPFFWKNYSSCNYRLCNSGTPLVANHIKFPWENKSRVNIIHSSHQNFTCFCRFCTTTWRLCSCRSFTGQTCVAPMDIQTRGQKQKQKNLGEWQCWHSILGRCNVEKKKLSQPQMIKKIIAWFSAFSHIHCLVRNSGCTVGCWVHLRHPNSMKPWQKHHESTSMVLYAPWVTNVCNGDISGYKKSSLMLDVPFLTSTSGKFGKTLYVGKPCYTRI